jgi:hypothetical protein
MKPSARSGAKLRLVATGQTKSGRQSVELPAAAPDPSFIRDSYSSTALAGIIDRPVHASTGRFTAGLSPMMLISAYVLIEIRPDGQYPITLMRLRCKDRDRHSVVIGCDAVSGYKRETGPSVRARQLAIGNSSRGALRSKAVT